MIRVWFFIALMSLPTFYAHGQTGSSDQQTLDAKSTILANKFIADASSDTSDEEGSLSGELKTKYPELDEEISVRYLTGRLPNLSQNSHEENESLAKNISATNTGLHGEKILFITTESSQNTLPIEYYQNNDIEKVVLTEAQVSGFKKYWNTVYSKPHKSTWGTAIVFTTMNGTILGNVILTDPKIDFYWGLAFVASVCVSTFVHERWTQTMDNIYGYRYFTKNARGKPLEELSRGGKLWYNISFFLKNTGWDMLVSLLANSLIRTNSIEYRLVMDFTSKLASNAANTRRKVVLGSNPQQTAGYKFMTRFVLYFIRAFDARKTIPLFTLGLLEVKPTMVLTYAFFGSILLSSHFAQKPFIAAVELVNKGVTGIFKGIGRVAKKIQIGATNFCNTALGGTDFTDHPSDFFD
jgi:hypothetical protein